jgi:hypothetical protein
MPGAAKTREIPCSQGEYREKLAPGHKIDIILRKNSVYINSLIRVYRCELRAPAAEFAAGLREAAATAFT